MVLRLRLAVVVLACGCGAALGDVSSGTAVNAERPDGTKSLVRVDVSSAEARQALKRALRSWDVAGTVAPGQSLDLVVTDREREELLAAGVAFETVIADVEQAQAGLRATYPSFPQLETNLATMAANYPAITELTSIGLSWEGRDIWCIEISDNPGVDEGGHGVRHRQSADVQLRQRSHHHANGERAAGVDHPLRESRRIRVRPRSGKRLAAEPPSLSRRNRRGP
jgi:hypothetical protein